jgi:hypothetical protein
MHLTRFSVQGYKNIRNPIELRDLEAINVIHGANNVGKSNLLQAIGLFFECLEPRHGFSPLADIRSAWPELGIGFVRHHRELFHLAAPAPIALEAVLVIPQAELEAAGLSPMAGSDRLTIKVAIVWSGDQAQLPPISAVFADGTSLVQKTATGQAAALALLRFLSRNPLIRTGPAERFALIGVRRDLELDAIPHDRGQLSLALEMFDARESDEVARRDRWTAFTAAMADFERLTGPGQFEVTFRRHLNAAQLVFDTPSTRTPLRLMGTGVQQAAALLGHILLRNAPIVAVEEPELNLRADVQDLVSDALQRLVQRGDPGGIHQMFLTSHSDRFEVGTSYFSMNAGPSGPTVERRPIERASLELGLLAEKGAVPDGATTSYVSSQGSLVLPAQVVERLGVQKGGGVVFRDAEPTGVRMLSNADFVAELMGPSEDDA